MGTLHFSKNRVLQSDKSLDIYLRDISRSSPLTLEEEVRLARRIGRGDRRALDRLVRANLRFVVSVCRNYQNQGLPFADLINEGNIGLLRGALRFDGKRNYRFISYAVWWIRQAILQALAEQSRIVKIPLNRVSMIYKIGKSRMRLEQKYKRQPTLEEIASELKVNLQDVVDTMTLITNPVSLDAPLADDENSEYLEIIPDMVQANNDFLKNSLQFEITKALGCLSKRERDVLSMYYGIGVDVPSTLEEIGKKYNLTRERIRQIKEQAIKKLKLLPRRIHFKVYC